MTLLRNFRLLFLLVWKVRWALCLTIEYRVSLEAWNIRLLRTEFLFSIYYHFSSGSLLANLLAHISWQNHSCRLWRFFFPCPGIWSVLLLLHHLYTLRAPLFPSWMWACLGLDGCISSSLLVCLYIRCGFPRPRIRAGNWLRLSVVW